VRRSQDGRAAGDRWTVHVQGTMALARGALFDRRHKLELPLRRVARVQEQNHYG
jgi:hypothetical protein